MALSASLLQSLVPGRVADYANQAADQQNQQIQAAQQQAAFPLAYQQAQLQVQSGQQDLANKRRGMAISLLNGLNGIDPEKQAALYPSLKDMANRVDPTIQFPDQFDPSMIRALTASTIDPATTAELALKRQSLGIEQQKADQGNYEPIKDLYGNPTGFMNKKTGDIQEYTPTSQSQLVPPVGADGNPVTGDAYLATLPNSDRSLVKAIGEGRMAPITGYSATRPLGMRVMQLVQNAYPDYNANSYQALKDFSTGKLGSTVRSLNVANDHLDVLSQYANALNNGDAQTLNKLSNSFKTQFGVTAPTNFNAAKQIVADEVIKAVVGAGGGVNDREEAQKSISQASSPEQLMGVIQTYKQLMRGQLNGLQQQYENATGRKDFLDRLSPSTRTEILGAQGAGQSNPAGAGDLSTPQSIGLAFQQGKLTRDQAKALLAKHGFQ